MQQLNTVTMNLRNDVVRLLKIAGQAFSFAVGSSLILLFLIELLDWPDFISKPEYEIGKNIRIYWIKIFVKYLWFLYGIAIVIYQTYTSQYRHQKSHSLRKNVGLKILTVVLQAWHWGVFCSLAVIGAGAFLELYELVLGQYKSMTQYQKDVTVFWFLLIAFYSWVAFIPVMAIRMWWIHRNKHG